MVSMSLSLNPIPKLPFNSQPDHPQVTIRFSRLLEAGHDAQEGNQDLPPELLKELAKNLFNGSSEASTENHPQAGIDVLLKGLSSIRGNLIPPPKKDAGADIGQFGTAGERSAP